MQRLIKNIPGLQNVSFFLWFHFQQIIFIIALFSWLQSLVPRINLYLLYKYII